jgi:hypothetical protein
MKSGDITSCVASISRTLSEAKAGMVRGWRYGEMFDSSDYYIELAFLELLLLAEKLELPMLYSRVASMYEEAKGKFGSTEDGPDEPTLVWGTKLRMVLSSLESMMGIAAVKPGIATLSRFLHESLYAITDKKCFASSPQNEEDVHRRIELALRCAYPDMKHKPTISQPIKNFEPDTGIVSLRTLIEYKFVANDDHSKQVADEILADTRGYEDPAWSQFIFVIYETKRFRSPEEWNELMRRCGTADKADVVVLCGENPLRRKRKRESSRRKQGGAGGKAAIKALNATVGRGRPPAR